MTIFPSELDGAVATNDFPEFEIDTIRFGGLRAALMAARATRDPHQDMETTARLLSAMDDA